MRPATAAALARAALTLWLAIPTICNAQVPAKISFQGYLTNAASQPITGTVQVTFRLYTVSSGGSALWTEVQPSVSAVSGVFNTTLGSVQALTLPFDVPYYLGIEVGNDGEMSPRQALASSPYALTASAVRYASPQTGRHYLHASAFTPSASSIGYGSNLASGNDRYILGTGVQHMGASVNIPLGVTVTDLTCRIKDASPTYNINARIIEAEFNSTVCGNATSSGSVPAYTTITVPCNFVANSTINLFVDYYVEGECGSSCSVQACWVTYTYTSPGR